MFTSDLKYATYVWLLSVFIAPILFTILPFGFFNIENGINLEEAGGLYFMMLLFGGLFSIPCWLVFMLLVRVISRMEQTILTKKTYIQVVAIIIGVIPFLLFSGFDDFEILGMAIPYLAVLSVGIWYFKLDNSRIKAEDNQILDDLLY